MMTRRIGLMMGVLVVFLAGVGMGVLAQDDTPPEVVQGGEAVNGVGTAFTYQGVLTDGGQPADGTYDLQFRLYDAVTGGNPIGSLVTVDNQAVSDGLLAVTLDFGEQVFGGSPRWLAISVRPGSSSGNYEALAGRQPLTASPYAIHSGTAQALAAEMQPPAVITVTASTGGGLPSGTYYFKIVASDGVGTTRASAEVSCTVDGVTTDRCALAWEAVPGVAAYRVYKGASSQGQDRYQSSSSNSYNYDGDGGATLGAVPTVTTAYVNHINPAGDSWLLGGNLGIGESTPHGTLSLYASPGSANSADLTLQTGHLSRWWISADATNNQFLLGGNGATRPTDDEFAITITVDDKVGIDTTNPTAKLDVAGNLNFDGQKACSISSIATGDSWRAMLLVPSDWTAGACNSLWNDLANGGFYQLFCVFENTYSFGAPGGGIPNPNCGW